MIALVVAIALLCVAGWYLLSHRGALNPGLKNANGEETVFQALDYESLSEAIGKIEQLGELKIVTTDVSNYPNIKLYVQVKDESGEDIELFSPTAAIREQLSDGTMVERTIRSVERVKDNEGVGFELLIDKSGSMDSDMPQMQQTMREFINQLDFSVGDKAEILSFDSYLMYMTTFTDKQDFLLNGIDNMTPYGQTALYDALYTGVLNAGNRLGANCVIAFTDGADNVSSRSYNEVIALAKEKEIPIYLIGTANAESSVLNSIAKDTGGEYWDIDAMPDMGDVLKRINSTQKNLYSLEYTSDKSVKQYDPHQIDVLLIDGKTAAQGAIFPGAEFTPAQKKQAQAKSSRYEIKAADVSWMQANDKCIAQGGHLATVKDQAEMNKLTSLAGGAGLKYVWLGGYTSERGGKVFGHWVTGEPFNFSAWYPGEPSRNDKDGEPEFYLMLWNIQGKWSWNDQRNDPVHDSGLSYFRGETGYICEYEQAQ